MSEIFNPSRELIPQQSEAPSVSPAIESLGAKTMFEKGEIVSYRLHGRCQIIDIEEKTIGGEKKKFFSLQTSKTIGSRNQGIEASVLVPFESAQEAGMRKPLLEEAEIEAVLKVLEEPSAYWPLDEHWKIKQKRIDDIVRLEGVAGMARALGHLVTCEDSARHVTNSEETKYQKLIRRVLAREISDAMGTKSTKEAEKRMNKALSIRMEEYFATEEF